MTETYINRIGIVDAVRAIRADGQVKYLVATARFETEIPNEYGYGEKQRVDSVDIAIGTGEGVNPGDVVQLNVSFTSPQAQRFQPALNIGNPADELDEDMLAEEAIERDDNFDDAVINTSQDA
jgi:hypothetical protein